MRLTSNFKNQGRRINAERNIFNHPHNKSEAEATQNTLASEICSTLAATDTNLLYFGMNCYYYSFYVLTWSIRRVNKRHFDPEFAAIAFFSLLIAFNVFTISGLLKLVGIYTLENKLFYLSVGFFSWFINHQVLYRKSKRLVCFLDRKYPIDKNKLAVSGVILYVFITLGLAAIVSTLVREMAIK